MFLRSVILMARWRAMARAGAVAAGLVSGLLSPHGVGRGSWKQSLVVSPREEARPVDGQGHVRLGQLVNDALSI